MRFETLEVRHVPSSFANPQASAPPLDLPNQTYDQAVDLGDVWASPVITRHGGLGIGLAGAADVGWYRFVLDRPARVNVQLQRSQSDSSFRGVLSLFDNAPENETSPVGVRRLTLDVADEGSGIATISRLIGPGTYNLAVSGAGNEFFSPIIADSGITGVTGEFNLSLSVIDVAAEYPAGPWVVNSEPAPLSVLDRSPLWIRLEMTQTLNPDVVEAGQSVRLEFSPDGTFDGARDRGIESLPFSTRVVDVTGELQVIPGSPLAPGFYRIVLVSGAHQEETFLASVDGIPLGWDARHPAGQDYVLTFQVAGIEGDLQAGRPANDTPAGARDLGDLTSLGLVQIAGAIGDDPFYNQANAPDPNGFDPLYLASNDLDLYHFVLSGPGRFTLAADVFAGRLGSYLTPNLRLYRLNIATQQLEPVRINSAGYDLMPPTDRLWSLELYDATMIGGLDAGDYYLAVSSAISESYDPAVSRSFLGGYATGEYVLSLLVRPAQDGDPHVLETSLSEGQVLTEVPRHLSVTFDKLMNLPIFLLENLEQNYQSFVDAIFLEAEDGTLFYPRLQEYDYANNQATFFLIDRLMSGRYELHLSGLKGLLDLAGRPLVGNHQSGDYVVSFTVEDSSRGLGVDSFHWTNAEPNDSLESAQDLGVLFPAQLFETTNIERSPHQDSESKTTLTDTGDYYRFELTTWFQLRFGFQGTDIPPEGVWITLRDDTGRVLRRVLATEEIYVFMSLDAGVYFIDVSGWRPDQAGTVAYELTISGYSPRGNAPGLLTRPAPSIAVLMGRALPQWESSVGGEGEAEVEAPPEHPAPPLPTPPSGAGAIVIGGSSLLGNSSQRDPVIGGGRPRVEGPLAFVPTSQARPRPGTSFTPSSSTDLSVLAFPPLGSAGRQTEVGQPRLLGIAPALPIGIVARGSVFTGLGSGNVSPDQRQTDVHESALQARVPWAPDLNLDLDVVLDPIEASSGMGFGDFAERSLMSILSLSLVPSPIPTAGRDVVPAPLAPGARDTGPAMIPLVPPRTTEAEAVVAVPATSLAKQVGDRSELEGGGSAPAMAPTIHSAREPESPSILSWKTGSAWLAATGLIGLGTVRYVRRFKSWRLGRSPFLRAGRQRSGLGEPGQWV